MATHSEHSAASGWPLWPAGCILVGRFVSRILPKERPSPGHLTVGSVAAMLIA